MRTSKSFILAVLALCFCVAGVVPIQVLSQPLAQGQKKFLGSSVPVVRADFTQYFNQVTPENAGKWGSVEGSQGLYYWTPLDDIFNFASSNRFAYKHHCLVWGQQQPSWITSLDSASQRAEVRKWIDTVGQRYMLMSFIDVVNEPIHAPPSYMNAIGGTGATGWDWVVNAFQWARQSCFRGVKLILNEYNILQDNTVATNFIKLIDTLRVRRLIDAIGIQGHYFEFKGSGYIYPIATLQSNLNRIAALGLPIYISEFDINEANDSTQLANYKIYFPLFWENPAVKGITLWGYVQGYTWKTDAYLVRSDGTERPALRWLRIYVATPDVISPIGATNQPRDASLVWHKSTPATSYRVQVALDSAFSSVAVDSTVVDTSLHVNPLAPFSTFYWRVCAVNSDGSSAYSSVSQFATGDQVVAVKKTSELPIEFDLSQNYPNPFNPTTRIDYSIGRAGYVSLRVYNLLGEEVAMLFVGYRQPGEYTAAFDGGGFATGVYFYRLQSGDFVATKRLILLK